MGFGRKSKSKLNLCSYGTAVSVSALRNNKGRVGSSFLLWSAVEGRRFLYSYRSQSMISCFSAKNGHLKSERLVVSYIVVLFWISLIAPVVPIMFSSIIAQVSVKIVFKNQIHVVKIILIRIFICRFCRLLRWTMLSSLRVTNYNWIAFLTKGLVWDALWKPNPWQSNEVALRSFKF